MQHVGHGRYMDNAAANPQEAGEIAYSNAKTYAHPAVIGERMLYPVRVNYIADDMVTCLALCGGSREGLLAYEQKDGCQDHAQAKDQIKGLPWHIGCRQRADDGAGNGRQRKEDP